MSTFLSVRDLTPFNPGIDPEQAAQMIEDVDALAVLVAPCIADPGFQHIGAVRALLRGAVLRWADAGSGALASQTAGPFGITLDTRTERRGLLWPSEIAQLQGMCSGRGGGAFSVDTTPGTGRLAHLDTCSVNFGANDCSCGVILISGLLP